VGVSGDLKVWVGGLFQRFSGRRKRKMRMMPGWD
jgi:hypothetical protein